MQLCTPASLQHVVKISNFPNFHLLTAEWKALICRYWTLIKTQCKYWKNKATLTGKSYINQRTNDPPWQRASSSATDAERDLVGLLSTCLYEWLSDLLADWRHANSKQDVTDILSITTATLWSASTLKELKNIPPRMTDQKTAGNITLSLTTLSYVSFIALILYP